MLLLLRMVILGLLAIVWLVLGLIVCICRPKNPNNVYLLAKMLGFAKWVLGVKVKFKTREGVEIKQFMPAVFVGNHQTNWDIVIMTEVIVPGVVCVGKKSLIWAPIFGILFWLSGNILIDRNNAKKVGGDFLKIVEKIKNNSLSIWMFPEGHRSKGKGLLPFKNGAVHTAMLANVSIIPFVTSSYVNQLKLNRWNNGEIIIEMLDPISMQGVERGELKKINQELRSKMLLKLKELDKEVKRPLGDEVPKYFYDEETSKEENSK